MKQSGWRLLLLFFPAVALAACSAGNYAAERNAAYLAYDAGEYSSACAQLLAMAAEIPKDAELWFKAGNACAKARYPDRAIEAYQNAVLRDPEMAKAWHNLGTVQMQVALGTFIEMEGHVVPDDPVLAKANKLRDGLAVLLNQDP